ncbi:ABC transporter ATP-binding protein/permease [Butyrivibrio sp. DSM 10294]|uniref:ABC transporter ATP-binding protein n=1 Tax=Butyrivibrio sp. DSM 10294 TaxID=2972457 RepID=UPI00234E839C|nr:ABC transporter ATP-binding protein [Butyrivibrio sp. DSM 10294]MDC7293514.1 ABC transporter ATP-binding protein/permease [Butyrivibrio sp. DSM 10294]
MKLIFQSMGKYKWAIFLAIFIKLIGTMTELTLPYILEYMIDHVVPAGNMRDVLLWGLLMFVAAIACRQFNVMANRRAINNAHKVSFDVRQALFKKTANLSGDKFDSFGLPSLISRMTSDSYNVQAAVAQLQSLCVRAPMMLFGGVVMTLLMDWALAMILIVMLPFLICVVFFVSSKGIPLYTGVQKKLDSVVRIMRENITGIRVVKALSKGEFEKRRFAAANEDMARTDMRAGTIMAIPGPFMQLCLNIGLTMVVIFGAIRVNRGQMQPGVILAFLTYFNMINMGVMGLNRIFMSMSKASASADRIDEVISTDDGWEIYLGGENGGGHIRFNNVSFSYGSESRTDADFAGGKRELALENISFSLNKGESLGIIGPTGCGKTTIVNLLMRFYNPDSGSITIDDRDIRSYEKDELRRKFGVVFQNDMVFNDSIKNNIDFGRGISQADLDSAAEDAVASEYIDSLDGKMEYMAAIKGANLSGGQKQRLLVARALAAAPEILILDDSSSALDYKTDSQMRSAIRKNHSDSTLIMIAQRVSSIMGMDHIMVMDNGTCIGYGTHEELMENCPAYRETFEMQTT